MTAAAAAAALTVTLSPAIAHPSAQVHVRVTGVDAPSALVVLHGGIARQGHWFGWVPLVRHGSRWSVLLKTPGLYGVYPVQLRVDDRTYTGRRALAVLPPGYSAQPAFATPTEVARWWAWLSPPGAIVRSVTTWQSGFYTHRDPALNRLLRVTFRLLGDWPAQHLRRGSHTLYLSVARLRPDGPWRLLEVVPAP